LSSFANSRSYLKVHVALPFSWTVISNVVSSKSCVSWVMSGLPSAWATIVADRVSVGAGSVTDGEADPVSANAIGP